MSSEEMRIELESFVNQGLQEGWGGWPPKREISGISVWSGRDRGAPFVQPEAVGTEQGMLHLPRFTSRGVVMTCSVLSLALCILTHLCNGGPLGGVYMA